MKKDLNKVEYKAMLKHKIHFDVVLTFTLVYYTTSGVTMSLLKHPNNQSSTLSVTYIQLLFS